MLLQDELNGESAITNLVNNKLSSTTHDGAEGYNSKFYDYIATIERAGVVLDNNLIKCLYLANINDDLYTTIKDQTSLDKLSMLEIQSLMLKKYTSTLGDRNDGTTRPHRQFYVSADIDQETYDSPLSSTQLKVTSGRTPSKTVPTKPPISGKGSPTSDTDPFHIEKSEWLSLSSSTKEKINMMKKQIRDLRPSSNNIHLFRSLDDTQPGQSPTPVDIQASEEPDPFSDTMRQFMIRAHRRLVTSVTRVRLPSNFHILEHKATLVYGRLISDSGADTGALSDTYAFIASTHDTQVTVDGCHPHTSKTYNLCDGIVAIDINNSTYLLGMRGVPLIPNSIGMLLSELQAHGIEIDSTPRIFGGKEHIVINGNIRIPLHLGLDDLSHQKAQATRS